MLATKILWVERMVGAAIIAHRCRRKIQGLAKKLPIERQAPMRDGVRRRFPGYSNDLWHRAYAAVNGASRRSTTCRRICSTTYLRPA